MSELTLSGAARAVEHVVMAMITYETSRGAIETLCKCVEGAPGRVLLAEDILAGHDAVRVVKASMFPAHQLLDIPLHDRPAFSWAFSTWLRYAACKVRGVAIEDARPWVDYCPITIDEQLHNWLRPGRFVGD